MARVFYHTSVFGAEVNPKMSRNRSKAVPEGNGPVLHYYEVGSGESTMADLYRTLEENFDIMDNNLDRMSSRFDRQENKSVELTEEMRATNQRQAGPWHGAQQPRLATDVEPETKTRKCTENVTADRSKNGDKSSARFDDGPTALTSFGMTAEQLAPEKCIGDALVNKGAEVPKPHRPPMDRMLSSATDGLLTIGAASTAMASFSFRLFLESSVRPIRRENTAVRQTAG